MPPACWSRIRTLGTVLTVLLAAMLGGCGGNRDSADEAAEDFVQTDEETTADDRRYLEFGRGAMQQLCARDYAAFFGQLASHAVARMSENQFAPADDDAEFARHEAAPRTNVSAAQFLELMTMMEARFGQPQRPQDLHVFSNDPAVLAGEKREGLDALDVMFAIGNMPDLVPAAQRKASLRGQIAVQLSAAQLAEAAEAYETTVEELTRDPEFQPYLNLKLVIIEENGALRVGYFEFLPPSMLD